jgi:hypothetical protein
MSRGSQADLQGQPRPANRMPGQPPRRPEQPGTSRFVLMAVLFIVILAGLGGAVTAPGWTGRFHRDGTLIGGVLEALLAALLAVLVIRGRRTEPTAFVAARLCTALSYVIIAAMVVIPLVLLSNVHFGISPHHQPPVHPPPPRPPHVRPGQPLPGLVYWLLGAIALAVLIGFALLLWRLLGWPGRWRRGAWRGRWAGIDEPGEPEELRGAVESGQAALRLVDDTRAAIIACYVAMEQSLASAGAARAIADTPDELLVKAAAAGLVRSGAAARLTALFYEARFSSHPMGQDRRDAAEQSLGEIAADLRARRPAATAASSPGSQS